MPDVHSERLCGLRLLSEIGLSSGSQTRAVSLASQTELTRSEGDAVARNSLMSVITWLFNQPHPFVYFSQYSIWQWPALDQILYNFFVANRVNTFQFTFV